MMALLRAFFALPVSPTAEQQFAEVSRQLQCCLDKPLGLNAKACAQIRWITPVNYHLTLAFLGNIRQQDVETLQVVAQEVLENFTAENLHFNTVEWFPSTLKPRLIAAIPEPNTRLSGLQKALTKNLRQQGFQLEKRPFRPHVSLARMGSMMAPSSILKDLADVSVDIDCELDELVLFKSDNIKRNRHSGGSVYTPLLVEPICSMQALISCPVTS